MEEPHVHCISCISRRCMVKPEPGTSCDLITCPLVCGAIFHGCKAFEHKLLCPLERVPCLNHSIGCPFTLAHGQMAEHLEVCPAGVVCCTMEWNRWPVKDEDYRSYERLSQEADEVEQLDMALGLQDQRTMLASLKLVSLAPTSGPEKKTLAAGQSEKPGIVSVIQAPSVHKETVEMEPSTAGCSMDKITNGINGLNEEHCSELYQTTVETSKSLAAALNILIHLNSSETDCTTTNASAEHPECNGELQDTGFIFDKIANGVTGLKEELQPHQHQTLMEIGRSLASALGTLGDAVNGSEPISVSKVKKIGKHNQSETLEFADVDMKDVTSEVELGAVGGIDGETSSDFLVEGCCNELHDEAVGECCPVMLGDMERQGFCNGSHSIADCKCEAHHHIMEATQEHHRCPVSRGSWELVGPLIPHRPEFRHGQHSFLIQETQAPLLQPTIHAQVLTVQRDSPLPVMALDFEGRAFERKLQNLQLLQNFMPLPLNGQKGSFTNGIPYRHSCCKMEDKAVDTSDLNQEPQDDPMGFNEIDFTAAALLFCLEESPRTRRISDTVYAFGGTRVDFGTQTFSFPAAILATSTMVGEVASASACDRAAPRLSQPSPFCTLRLDLTLEQLVPRPSWAPREGSMFTFECGQLFRREEFLSHFRNVHGDIHSGLNGWMEHRCPLAYYGCTFSQRRLCPSTQGSKVVHDRHLRSFGVQLVSKQVTEPNCDHLSGLPFEVLQHVARFLDGFSLCQLSMVSRTMRDVCASLLQTRGMVVVQWEKKQYSDGRHSWQIKDKVWRFSTAFSPVNRWEFANIYSMADHLKCCPFNEVLRQVEAVPLPCMCTTRELTRDGRSLRSVLKPV
ncbi:F-box only protein 30-like [Xyrauchen texanus]|uniref:F-box only protein 30-like n=1 Tax=Xyrauchen texanus TaxID=154827 RepID=UPI002241DFF7|nr:F-box only protein 30-like [Xyrauchen texanus]XP_051961385.1 F-box only protein 30-like [Xyrauchen texanus]XP_051961386.1 F-box only protein 30-like [Xyrauchen texanus]XP_051961387.1 F-box only protein 30-like [Xyrauchen texanus]